MEPVADGNRGHTTVGSTCLSRIRRWMLADDAGLSPANSKTAGRGFESLRPCQISYLNPPPMSLVRPERGSVDDNRDDNPEENLLFWGSQEGIQGKGGLAMHRWRGMAVKVEGNRNL